jgi:hypothetical protein
MADKFIIIIIITITIINLFNESVYLHKGTVTGDELDWRLSIIHFVKFRFEIGLNFSVMELLSLSSMLRIFCHFGQEKTVAALKIMTCRTRRED